MVAAQLLFGEPESRQCGGGDREHAVDAVTRLVIWLTCCKKVVNVG